MTARYVLLGHPVEHSPSPAMYAAAFRALGVDATYTARSVTSVELPAVLREVAAEGGGNVTLPHKLRAAAVLDERTSAVQRSGACNCFWGAEGDSLVGDNTDVGGFLAAARGLADQAGIRLQGARCLVVGAGGAARAVLVGLGDAGVAAVDVLNRNAEHAQAMLRAVQIGSTSCRVLEAPDQAGTSYDLTVNATPIGMRATDGLPIDLSSLRVLAALDCVYGRAGTRWTRHASEQGVPAIDGLSMLAEQARLSVRNWLGLDPPVDVMRNAAAGALGGID